MRYVNRRSLAITMVLGALLGAALPYLADIYRTNSSGMPSLTYTKTRDGVAFSTARARSAEVHAFWFVSVEPNDSDFENIFLACEGRIPRAEIEQLRKGEQLLFGSSGWPFRSTYFGCRYRSLYKMEFVTPTLTTPSWFPFKAHLPDFWPTAFHWKGVAGNCILCVLLFAATYLTFTHLRARRRIKHNKCFKCGYLRNDAPICPECGTPLSCDETPQTTSP